MPEIKRAMTTDFAIRCGWVLLNLLRKLNMTQKTQMRQKTENNIAAIVDNPRKIKPITFIAIINDSA